MIATYVQYITALFTQDIWRDCIEPQERHNTSNIQNQYFSNYEMCLNGWFSKIQSQYSYVHRQSLMHIISSYVRILK